MAEQQVVPGLIEAVKKVTIKEILKGKPPRETREVPMFDGDGNPVMDGDVQRTTKKEVAIPGDLAVIAFKVHSHKTGRTSFGDYTEYFGVIQARRLTDGKIVQGSRYIPTPIADDLLWNMYSAAKQADEGAVVEGVFVIGVEPDNRSKDGYKWTCKPVLTPEQHAQVVDPFADMFARVAAAGVNIPGIEAPKSAPALDDKSKKAEKTA